MPSERATPVEFRRPSAPRGEGPTSTGCTVVVCRGCCCGEVRKHPHTDHANHLARLERVTAATEGVHLRVSRCLDVCSWSNVVVVRPHGPRRHVDAWWFGRLNGDQHIDALVAWIEAGGPGVAALPPILASHVIPVRAEETVASGPS